MMELFRRPGVRRAFAVLDAVAGVFGLWLAWEYWGLGGNRGVLGAVIYGFLGVSMIASSVVFWRTGRARV